MIPSITAIIESTSHATGVPIEVVLSRSKHREAVRAKALCAHLLRERRFMSYPEIAKAMCGTTHSTHYQRCRFARDWIGKKDERFLALLGAVEAELDGRFGKVGG